jgi:hypothetical protein
MEHLILLAGTVHHVTVIKPFIYCFKTSLVHL